MSDYSSDGEPMPSYDEHDVILMPPSPIFVGEEVWTAETVRLIQDHVSQRTGMKYDNYLRVQSSYHAVQ